MKKNHAPVVLLVDDNRDLLHFLARLMAEAGWVMLTAESAGAARRIVLRHKPDAALLDYILPDGNGIELGVQLRQRAPNMRVLVMTGSVLPPEEMALIEEFGFPLLRKPFRASDLMTQIRRQLESVAQGRARKKLKRRVPNALRRALKGVLLLLTP